MLKRGIVSALLIIAAAGRALAAPPPVQERHQLHMKAENAECLIRRHPMFVKTWTTTLPATEAEKKVTRPAEAYFTSCFANWPNAYASTWNFQAIRQRLINELLRSRLATLSETAPAGLNRAAWYPADQARDPQAAPALLANGLGFCLARADWPTARALVISEEGSNEEKSMLRKLVPMIAGCIPPGQKLTLDTDRLRSIMIETVYHATTD